MKATSTAVTEGDADAGIVYVTDAKAAGAKVDAVDDPRRRRTWSPATRSPCSRRRTNEALRRRRSWTTSLGPEGQAVLKDAGFQRRRDTDAATATAAPGGRRRRGRGRVLRPAAHRPAPAGVVVDARRRPHARRRRATRCACRSSARSAPRRSRSLFGVPLAWVLARVDVPRPRARAGARAAAAGAAAGRRRRRAVLRVRPPRARRRAPLRLVRRSSCRSPPPA